MACQSDLIHPPCLAEWLVTLFTLFEEAEAILGDLHEEYSQHVSTSGIAFARSWYWRQSLRTIAHLFVIGFRTAPWSIAAVLVCGLLLTKLLRFYQPAMTMFLDRFDVYEYHPGAYIFWLSYGLSLGHVAFTALIGVIVALVVKGREMTATVALSLILSTWTALGFLLLVIVSTRFWLWMVPWSFASSIAPIVGGTVVRMWRSTRMLRPPIT